jgi:hypothetical protein
MKVNIYKIIRLRNITDIFGYTDKFGKKYCEGRISDYDKPDNILINYETHKILSKSYLCDIMSFNFIITKLVRQNIIKKID